MADADQVNLDAATLDRWTAVADQIGPGNTLSLELHDLFDDTSLHRLRRILEAIDEVRGSIGPDHDNGLDGLQSEISGIIDTANGLPDEVA